MGKVVVTEFISLDGVIEEPSWSLPYWNDEIAKFKDDEQASSGSLLLGRVTYDGFAAVWPTRTDPAENPERMNAIPKYMVSKTLQKADWNNSHILREISRREIDRIMAKHPGDILVYGSGTLVQSLLNLGLVDQINLLIYPLVLSKGKRLFTGQTDPGNFKLVNHAKYGSDVMMMMLQPSKNMKIEGE